MEYVNFKYFEDERGLLLPVEFFDLPFTPKRVFIVKNVPLNMIRGNHSHYKTKQYLICVNGTVDVILHDGFNEITHKLTKGESILIPELIWDSQKFTSENSEILVLCSNEYRQEDYILDFEIFKQIKNELISNV
jgi:dTDP-4-dehydrorhamnose 3,5-epimerase-like enzyme